MTGAFVAVKDAWRVASYRFRATFARRRAGLLAIVVLIGLTGGIALGSLAGARRTQSSYPRFLASTNPSDLTVTVFNTSGGSTTDLTASWRASPTWCTSPQSRRRRISCR